MISMLKYEGKPQKTTILWDAVFVSQASIVTLLQEQQVSTLLKLLYAYMPATSDRSAEELLICYTAESKTSFLSWNVFGFKWNSMVLRYIFLSAV